MLVDLVLLAGCSAIWLLTILASFEVMPLAGTLTLDLYRLYSIAAVLGWVAGNIYVYRAQMFAEAPPGQRAAVAPPGRPDLKQFRKRLLLGYLIGPLSVVYLLRIMAAQAVQQAAPLVPVYSFAVYGLFFLVPLTLRATRTPRRGFRDQ